MEALKFLIMNFITKIKDFGHRFFNQMKKQVDLAVKKDWKEIQNRQEKTDRRA